MRTKLLTLFTALVAFSLCPACTDGAEEANDNAKRYQIINNCDYYYSSTDSYLDGTMYEVVVFQYDEYDDIIKQDNLPNIKYGDGKSSVIVADSHCDKVQVSFKMLPAASPYYDLSMNNRRYIVAKTYLTNGETSIVTLNGETMVSTSSTRSSGGDGSISMDNLLIQF